LLPVDALFAYWFVVRPILRDAQERASSAALPAATASSIDV
jgi:hypothetical protein